MTEQRHQGPGERPRPIPRDMPDQQAGSVEDPWDIRTGRRGPAHTPDTTESAKDVPDTDEAGTGRRGAPHQDTAPTDHPVPDEPSD
ncbi:hypothetical protein [Streptomyces sp. NPDC052036]|uniref:hypothetical protein n=1 Tax=unclassified Streptomyces TaxID=2593676 RepID=UPI00342305F8